MRRRTITFLFYSPNRAFSSAAISNFFIFRNASVIRFISSWVPLAIISSMLSGTICHDMPNWSFTHPHCSNGDNLISPDIQFTIVYLCPMIHKQIALIEKSLGIYSLNQYTLIVIFSTLFIVSFVLPFYGRVFFIDYMNRVQSFLKECTLFMFTYLRNPLYPDEALSFHNQLTCLSSQRLVH